MIDENRRRPIKIVDISRVHVLNPRVRNKRQHREIVDNIEAVGLKRPITVRPRAADDGTVYDLVCGEGRLDALRMLGATEIPAVIINAEENQCLVMSLVENIARRQHRPIDIMQEIGSLHRRGYNDAEIATKLGCTASWINMVVTLIERGEERLLAAVETGLIPVSLAVDIARAESDDAQDILMDAFETGTVKGKKVGIIRRLLDQRMKRQKGLRDNVLGRKSNTRRLTGADLLRLYQQEGEKQRLLVKKSDFTQAKLIFLVEALKDLLADDSFATLLRAEQLATMPRALAARIAGSAAR